MGNGSGRNGECPDEHQHAMPPSKHVTYLTHTNSCVVLAGRIFPIDSQSNPLSLTIAMYQLLGDGLQKSTSTACFFNMFTQSWAVWHQRYLASTAVYFTALSERMGHALFHHIFQQYHVRLLCASRKRPSPVPNLTRESGSIRSSRTRGRLFVHERRITVGIRTTCNLDLPVFSLVVLADFGIPDPSFSSSRDLETLDPDDCWHSRAVAGRWLGPSIRATGIFAFAFRLLHIFEAWARDWKQTLDEFEAELAVEVKDILSRKRRHKHMYDESDLSVSELYFFISQMLRFAAVWIRESTDDLHTLVRFLEVNHFSVEGKGRNNAPPSFLPESSEAQQAMLRRFRQTWEVVTSQQQKLADDLLGRIARMQEEVKTLREGVRIHCL